MSSQIHPGQLYQWCNAEEYYLILRLDSRRSRGQPRRDIIYYWAFGDDLRGALVSDSDVDWWELLIKDGSIILLADITDGPERGPEDSHPASRVGHQGEESD